MLTFEAVIVDSDLSRRSKLKQAAHALVEFSRVYSYGTFNEAFGKLDSELTCDVLFVSYRFGTEEIAKFIRQIEQTSGGQDAAFVVVLSEKDVSAGSVLQNMVSGIDGFLVEPFSADALKQITELAARVKLENATNRFKTAASMMIDAALKEIDREAMARTRGIKKTFPPKKLKMQLRETVESFEKMGGNVQEIFSNLIVDAFDKVSLPAGTGYAGASARVRKKLEAQLLEDLEKDSE